MTEPKYVEVVRELLDNGADVNKTNKVCIILMGNFAILFAESME